jgi:hypothetical protein
MPGAMNRWLAHAAALLALLALLVAARTAHADDLGALAAEAGVDPVDLAGAVNTTGMDARSYLCMTGELPCYVVVFDTGVQEQPDGTAISAIQVRRVFTPQDTLAAIDRVPTMRSWVYSTVRCETGGTFNPYARGRAGERGAAQLHPAGLLPHFRAVGYSDPDNPYMAVEYLWRAFSGEWVRQGVNYRHWTCA